MKVLVTLLLVVASVHSSSLHHYGWGPGKEMVFNYQSQVLTDIPEVIPIPYDPNIPIPFDPNWEPHWTGIKMNAIVTVQSFSDYSLRLRISEPEFLTIYGQDIKQSETGHVLREQESDSVKVESLSEEFRHFLTEPFIAHMKAGVVESLLVSKNEPASVSNIKKSILSEIQMDVTGTRRLQLETNQIQMPVTEEGLDQISSFTTMEESVQGECQTEYTIKKLSQQNITELEESQHETGAEAICDGKPYYSISKFRNLEQCKKSPFLYGMTVSTTNTVVCGELNEFVIRKVAHKTVSVATINDNNTGDKVTSTSQVKMTLLKIKNIISRMIVPTTTKTLKSLIFAFPSQINGEEQLNSDIVEKTEELLGFSPLLLKPGLTSAHNRPHDFLLELNKEQMIQHILKVAREVYQSQESSSTESDLASKLSILSMYMRNLNLTQLVQLEKQILKGSRTTTGMKSMEKIFYNILSIGANPSTMRVLKALRTRKCFDKVWQVGCFEWEGHTGLFPNSPEKVDTRFLLYTRHNQHQEYNHQFRSFMDTPHNHGIEINYTNVAPSLRQSNFNPDLPTKFIIHGFDSSGLQEWINRMKNDLLDAEDCNVIVVDWQKGAGRPSWISKSVEMPSYLLATANTRLVGRQVGQMVLNLGKHFNIPNFSHNTHVIGHSLGGQTAGYAGQYLRLKNHNLARITGLDPAQPLYEGKDAKLKLDPTDADFVQVIHTNAASSLVGGLGEFEQSGHVDFYPNGGKWQPGCEWYLPGVLHYLHTGDEGDDVTCNHARAEDLYSESVEGQEFTGFACKNYDSFVKGRCFPCGTENGGVECRSAGWPLNTTHIERLRKQKLFFLTLPSHPFAGKHLKISLRSDTKMSLDGEIEVHLKDVNGKDGEVEVLDDDNLTKDKKALEKVIIVSKDFTPESASITYVPNDDWFHRMTHWWHHDNLKINKLVVTDFTGTDLGVNFHFVQHK